MRKGVLWLKTVLVQAGWAAARKKHCYPHAQFQFLRLKSRRGPKKAIAAVAASILTAAYYMMRLHIVYQDLRPDHFDFLERANVALRFVRKLLQLRHEVDLNRAA